jgi:amino acid transporter
MKKFYFTIFILFILFGFANSTFAQLSPSVKVNEELQTGKLADLSGLNQDTSLASVISSLITVFLSFLGIIFLILMIYSGYNWMTAGGEEEKVKKAQSTIKKAIIGLIITVSAYSISYFVFNSLNQVNKGEGGMDASGEASPKSN